MTHARKQIRDLVLAQLVNGMPTPRTFAAGRQYPVQPDQLPAVLVYTREEVGAEERNAMGAPPIIAKRLELLIVGVINVNDDDDLADQLALEVDTVIYTASVDGGALAVLGIELDYSTVSTTISAATETQKGVRVVEVRYALNYRTRAGAPDVIVR